MKIIYDMLRPIYSHYNVNNGYNVDKTQLFIIH